MSEKQTEAIKNFEREILNIVGDGPDKFVDYILADHRTLQQNMGRIVIKLIEGWAEMYDNGRYDLRNEGTVEFAKNVRDKVLKDGNTYLPFV